MDLYSINDLDNNPEININDLKNSYVEYGQMLCNNSKRQNK